MSTFMSVGSMGFSSSWVSRFVKLQCMFAIYFSEVKDV